MSDLAVLARAARDALVAGDQAALACCVDQSFEARRRILTLDPGHIEMIDCARACGASANFAGSGGAIVAVCTPGGRDRVARALRALRALTLFA
jgi:glucuronokinase